MSSNSAAPQVVRFTGGDMARQEDTLVRRVSIVPIPDRGLERPRLGDLDAVDR
jgi:hypothetical protein